MIFITDFTEFAANRRAQFITADNDLSPIVTQALADGSWDDVMDQATQIWLDTFNQYAPDARYQDGLETFQKDLLAALEKTAMPDGLPDAGQVDRVTKYVGTASVNDGTLQGTHAAGGRRVRWVTMHDEEVRTTHARADGQVRPVTEKFDVGGAQLRYPGDPTGPVDEVINCRCVIAPVGGRSAMAAAAAPVLEDDVADVDDEDIEAENIDDEDLVDDQVEIPWHAVLAPEEAPTGDGRMFAKDSLSWRQLPLPLLYQHATGVGHAGAVRVGRIDEIWKTDTGEVRARGVFNGTPDAQLVIEMVMDQSIGGASVDVDDIQLDYDRSTEDAMDINGGNVVFSKARIAGLTLAAIGAYAEAHIALGSAFEDELTDEDRAVLAACGCNEAVYEPAEPPEAGFAISEADWDGSAGNYTDEQWFAATIVHTNGDSRVKGDNKVPIYTPDGSLSRAGVHAAAGRIGQTDATPEQISSAKGKLRGAYKQLNEEPPESLTAAAFAPGTKDGPGWLTNPRATSRIRRYWTHGKGAAKIRWGQPGDFNRCRKQLAKYVQNPEWLAGTCANMHKEAIGVWPGTERGGRHSLNPTAMSSVTLVASARESVLPAEAFQDPHFTAATPLTVDGNRIYGHVAAWGVCHIGIQDVCTVAPHSMTHYGYFRTGLVDTDNGQIPVGHITMGTGHANMKAGMHVAAAHYDNTGAVVADVAAGEDAYGIWFAGILRPGLAPEDLHALKAAALSGDWRPVPAAGNNLELVAALAVNVPGFPIPRTSLAASAAYGQESLVAAGVVTREYTSTLDSETIAAIARTAVDEYRHKEAAAERGKKFAPVRENIRQLRVASLRQQFQKEEVK